MKLASLLTLDLIQTLAGAKSYARGLAYFHEGAVGLLAEDGHTVTATVQGTHRYRVSLSVDEEELEYDCTCPVGTDGLFCKHAVALALSWLENSGEEVFPPDDAVKPKKKRISKAEQLRQYLETLPEAKLRDLLMDAAERDRSFRDKLLLTAKSASSKSVGDLRGIVNQATRVNRYDEDAYNYAERMNDLADLLEKRIDDGDADLVELIEDAIFQAEGGQEQIDDSDGDTYSGIERLGEVHLLACQRLNPDPVDLAERLFRYQMEGGSETFYAILPDYAGALGEAGLTRYEERVLEKWGQLPKLTPGNSISRTWDARRSRLESTMTQLATKRGDVETLIAVFSRDLSSPRNYLRLAGFLKEHQRFDEALACAEEGIASFPKDYEQDELKVFAIEEYLRRKDYDTAEKLAWDRFERRPGDSDFFELLKTAKRIDRLDCLRQRAMDFLKARIAREEASGEKPSIWSRCSRDTLLEIHLAEQNAEAMWATLNGGPTSSSLWEKCADLRGKTHPEDAIPLYLKLLPKAVDQGTSNARYESAFRIVQAIGKLRKKQDRATEFKQELARIRLEYKAKRNFIKLLSVLG